MERKRPVSFGCGHGGTRWLGSGWVVKVNERKRPPSFGCGHGAWEECLPYPTGFRLRSPSEARQSKTYVVVDDTGLIPYYQDILVGPFLEPGCCSRGSRSQSLVFTIGKCYCLEESIGLWIFGRDVESWGRKTMRDLELS